MWRDCAPPWNNGNRCLTTCAVQRETGIRWRERHLRVSSQRIVTTTNHHNHTFIVHPPTPITQHCINCAARVADNSHFVHT